MTFSGAGFHPGVIAMGSSNNGVLGAIMPFRNSVYGINYDTDTGVTFLYKVVATPSAPTGVNWFLLPSVIFLNPTTMIPQFALDDSTILVTETISDTQRALRIIKRTGDTLALGGSQASEATAPFATNVESNICARVSDSTFSRGMCQTTVDATISGCSVSGTTISVESSTAILAHQAAAIHYDGAGHLIGQFFDGFFGEDQWFTVHTFSVSGGVSASIDQAAANGAANYILLGAIDGSPEMFFDVAGAFKVGTTLSGTTVVESAPYRTLGFGPDGTPIGQPNPYVEVRSSGLLGLSELGYVTLTQSGTTLTESGMTLLGVGPSDYGVPAISILGPIARHTSNLVAAIVFRGLTADPLVESLAFFFS